MHNGSDLKTIANLPTLEVAGARVQFVASPEEVGDGQMSILRGTLWSGLVVPLHSHPDPECFFLLEGELECFQGADPDRGWLRAKSGDLVTIPGGVKHAWRNSSKAKGIALILTGASLFRFFESLAKPCDADLPPSPPSEDSLQELFRKSVESGHWMGSPQDNAAIGLPGF